MRAVVQRVSSASVAIDGRLTAVVGYGLMVLLGIEEDDGQEDVEWLCGKISRLRIFDDPQGIMNLSVTHVRGEIQLVSQFTLHASVKKGNRPTYVRSAKPEKSKPLY